MGMYLYLTLPEGDQINEQIIDEYYDYVEAKERDYYLNHYPGSKPEELQANIDRGFDKEYHDEEGEVYIYEQIYSNITDNVTIGLRDLFPSYYESNKGNPEIFGDDIKELTKRLRDAKDDLKEQDNDTNWEMTFELQIIALCEFALEHGYGIELG